MKKGIYLTIDDYEITRDGKVINKHTGKERKLQRNNKGYYRLQLTNKKRYFIHRLVAEKYIPNPDNKSQVNHIDGDKSNNCVNNLEWVTNLENREHAIKNRLQIFGEDCSWSKLSEKDVVFIRENKDLYTKRELANKFNVRYETIRAVLAYKSWKHIK